MKNILSILVFAIACISHAQSQIVCPILGHPIVPGSNAVQYKGLLIEFCCPGCDATFLADPEKALAEAQKKGVIVAQSLFDPVAKTRIEAKDSKAYSDFNGVRYYFTSEENKTTFDEFPQVYAQIPKNESLICPVMKNQVDSHANAAGYADFEGTRYYFCCPGCDTAFAEDPAKYAASVKGSVSSVKSGGAKENRTMAPTCAGCAGEAKLVGPNGLPTKWTFTYRYVDIDDPKAQHRFTLDYAINPRLYVGLERAGSDSATQPVPNFEDDPFDYLGSSDGDALILPRFSWFITPEGDDHPSLLVGLASDRLSTPRGQAFFLTASKKIKELPVTPFVSIKTNTWDGRTVFPFGVNVNLKHDLVFQGINDGDFSHFLLTKMENQQAYSLLLARGKHFGVVVSWGF